MSWIRATVIGGQRATRRRLKALDRLYPSKERTNDKIYRCSRHRDTLIGGQGLGTLTAAATEFLYEGNLGNDAVDFPLPPIVDETLTENSMAGSNCRRVVEVSNDDRAIVPGRAAYVDSSLIPMATLMADVFGGNQNVSNSSLRSVHREHRKQLPLPRIHVTPTVLERRK